MVDGENGKNMSFTWNPAYRGGYACSDLPGSHYKGCEIRLRLKPKGMTIVSDSDDDGSGTVTCTECHGTRKFERIACPFCGGRGYRIKAPGPSSKRRLDKPSRGRPTPKKT